MRVKNDIAATLEKGKVVLVVLDLSSACDTIYHDILMNRLQHFVGMTEAAIHSYTTERYQRVAVDSATSADCVVKYGVPQGPVLGPTLYCMHTRPIGDIVARHIYHIYMGLKHNQPNTEASIMIERCFIEVTDWYRMNQLQLITEKSKTVIFLTSKQRNDLPSDISVTIGGHRVVPKQYVRNMEVILDSGLTMQAQVAQIAKSCYHHICNIGKIRSSITDDVQRGQNCAVRLVSRTWKYDHITPVLQHLHWLPIYVCSTYKVLQFAYSGMHDQSPCFIAELRLLTSSAKSSTEVCVFAAIDTTCLTDGHSRWSQFCRSLRN